MPKAIEGTYTIKEVLQLTSQKFKTRYRNAKRDKLRFIKIKTIKYYDPDRIGAPSVLYEIITQSTPQYKPYANAKDKRGRYRKSQTSIKHDYDCTLQMDRLSLNTRHWKMVIGKLRKIKKPKQDFVAQIYRETREKWKKRYKTKEALDKKIRSHKRKAKYISVGDWQSQELGINQDFLFRCAYVYKKYNHLYELGGYKNAEYLKKPPTITNKQQIMFFPKHAIILIKYLMQAGILKDD